jgi:hypothetical protein
MLLIHALCVTKETWIRQFQYFTLALPSSPLLNFYFILTYSHKKRSKIWIKDFFFTRYDSWRSYLLKTNLILFLIQLALCLGVFVSEVGIDSYYKFNSCSIWLLNEAFHEYRFLLEYYSIITNILYNLF